MSFDALIPLLFGAIGLAAAYFLCEKVQSCAQGIAALRDLGEQIHLGGMAFMRSTQQSLGWICAAFFVLLWIFLDFSTALSFVIGALACASAAYIGMHSATRANVPVATAAAERSAAAALSIAFSSAAIMGLALASLGVLGLGLVYLFYGASPTDARAIYGFGLGAAVVALLCRVGGGIFRHGTAIDATALVTGQPPSHHDSDGHNDGHHYDDSDSDSDGAENEQHNAAAMVIGGIGNNVGAVAGMGAELFTSYSAAIIASIALAASMPETGLLGPRASLMFMPLALASAGLVCAILGIMLTRGFTDKSAQAALRAGTLSAILAFVVLSFFVLLTADAATILWWAVVAGATGGVIISLTTAYFTAGAPVISIAKAAQSGAATAINSGLVIGLRSVLVPVLSLCAVIALASEIAGLYGIGIAAVGMLATLGITMALSAYSPIANNACSIAKLADLDAETQKITAALDELGHRTAAISQGFSIGAAALTALALSFAFVQAVSLHVPGFSLNLSNPQVLIGVLIGAVLTFFIGALTMSAAGDAAREMIDELRRQLRVVPGRAAGAAHADTTRCVEIAAQAALSRMTLPGVVAVLAPLVVGFGISPEALGGMLGGALLSCVVLALTMSNAGNAWNNARKYVEKGHLGGTDSAAHAALRVCAGVGGPFKDTTAASMNMLVNIMAIVSLLIAPLMS